jgi:UDP-2,4-diacetamido-2,4,6-trideoxy-beta-L-altropyranose hydrolase
MNVAFRVDASLEVGIGHVMRCLTLADILSAQGEQVSFICREHPGHLILLIEQKGYFVCRLEQEQYSVSSQLVDLALPVLAHAKWLGASQREDAQQCQEFLAQFKPDWLIVDHYAIDYRWQQILQADYKQLMVIDDLADRVHQCALLLDQSYGRKVEDYLSFVPKECTLLVGSEYALLRPEFAQWRSASIARRIVPEFKKLLITMGGVDADNVTGQVLEALQQCLLPKDLTITVVMGVTAPHLDAVKQLAANLPIATQLKVNVQNIAELMTESDLAIGAAGATTWERCCLGLPTVAIVLAENQGMIAEQLEREHRVWLVKRASLALDLNALLEILSSDDLRVISSQCQSIVDGFGADKVAKALRGKCDDIN